MQHNNFGGQTEQLHQQQQQQINNAINTDGTQKEREREGEKSGIYVEGAKEMHSHIETRELTK